MNEASWFNFVVALFFVRFFVRSSVTSRKRWSGSVGGERGQNQSNPSNPANNHCHASPTTKRKNESCDSARDSKLSINNKKHNKKPSTVTRKPCRAALLPFGMDGHTTKNHETGMPLLPSRVNHYYRRALRRGQKNMLTMRTQGTCVLHLLCRAS